MCITVREVPISARAGLVLPCRKMLDGGENGKYVTCFKAMVVPDDGWLFPEQRSDCTDWYYGHEVRGGIIHAFDAKRCEGCNDGFPAWAIGVLGFDPFFHDLIARAVFVPKVATKTNRVTALRTTAALRRLYNGHGGRRELFELHPKLRYALTGKR